jgi:hypothetical protein
MKKSQKVLIAIFLFILLGLFTKTGANAAEGGRAAGRFDSKDLEMNITDAYAFYGEPSLGGREKVIVVVVSNQGLIKAALDEYWDRKNALERYFKDEKTGLVYLEFSRDGRYRGLSYYFGPGNGCGYCSDTEVKSTVSFKDGKITGDLSFPKGSDPDRWFEISLDVPVSNDEHGNPQGAGGGVPGKAYLAYHRTLSGKDVRAIRARLSEERRKRWDKAEKDGNGPSFLAFLREDHPSDVRVREAYVSGDKALLILDGKGAMGKVRGEAQLSRYQAEWRFDEETFSPAVK